MTAYEAPDNNFLKNRMGTDSSIIAEELKKVEEAINHNKPLFADITASMVSSVGLSSNGVDLASGTDHTFYSVFPAPVDLTIESMSILVTEDYQKESIDAKIELKTNDASPITICSYTFPEEGVSAGTMINVAPDVAALVAGKTLNIVTTETGSSTGTGRAKIFLKYYFD